MSLPQSDNWLILGSSPAAWRALRRAQSMLADTDYVVITTNAGIKLVRVPHYYLLHDPHAVIMFCDLWQFARSKGTKIIKSVLSHSKVHAESLSKLTADITIKTYATRRPGYQRGKSISPACSGAIAAQYAVHNGCKHLILAGMCGYRSKAGCIHVETFDHRRGHAKQGPRTYDRYGPLMASMVRCRPDVQFTWIGIPIYAALLKPHHNAEIVALPAVRSDARSTVPASTRNRRCTHRH